MKPPKGHINIETIVCPRCGDEQHLEWNTAPPGRTDLGQAMHGPSDTCNVVRLGKSHEAPDEEAVMLQWRDADNNLTDVDPDALDPDAAADVEPAVELNQ
ncbi:MAG: hypothetical protein JWN99_1050 [Ilumatobacteraceae bacterium]|nr:hypothetical protein [Ilumatobacteraceae bacterium]